MKTPGGKYIGDSPPFFAPEYGIATEGRPILRIQVFSLTSASHSYSVGHLTDAKMYRMAMLIPGRRNNVIPVEFD